MKDPLFTWNNFKFLIKELVKLGSKKPSYFDQQEVNEITAFISAMAMVWIWFFCHINTMGIGEILGITAVLFGIAGYYTNKKNETK
jgi:amino acid transporter